MANKNPKSITDGLTPAEIRKEYSRMRAIANKRISRLEAHGYQTEAKYPRVVDAGDIANALADVDRFLKKPTSTVKGWQRYQAGREKAAITLGRQMNVPIDSKEVRRIGKFMDAVKTKYSSLQVTSDVAMDVYKFGRKNHIPMNVLRAHYEEFKNELTDFELLSLKYETEYKPGGGGAGYLERLHAMLGKEKMI